MIRVLVTDDSAFMRKVISDILRSDAEIEVVGIARDGNDCIEKIKELDPDVITLDVEMPNMNGLEALKIIMEKYPRPVVMISSLTYEGSKETLQALRDGAVDFIAKPSGSISLDMDIKSDEIIRKVKGAYNAKLQKFETKSPVSHSGFSPSFRKIVAIASSTGGPGTVEQILSELPGNIPVPILLVQHMPPNFTKSFAERLNTVCDVKVVEASEGDIVENGVVYIAPGDFHMELFREGDKDVIHLNQKPRELGVRPNANMMMKSVADIYKEKTIGLVLTGMGNDGTLGAKAIKDYGGTVLVQDESTSVIFGMPKSVIEHQYYDAVVPLPKIATALIQFMEL